MRYLVVFFLIASITGLGAGCGGSSPAAGHVSLITVDAADEVACPGGGYQIYTGLDKNRNGELDDPELLAGSSWAVCTGTLGTTGVDGQGALSSAPRRPCPTASALWAAC